MLCESGPSIIAGKSVRTSISRVMVRARGGRPAPARRASSALAGLRARGDAAFPRGPAWRPRSVGVRAPFLGRSKVERLRVHDDLAAARREDPDERPHRRHVERAVRPAAHDVDLVLGDAVDVLDDPELRPVDAAHGHPEHLVPVDLAAGQVRLGPDRRSRGTRPRRVSAASRDVDLAEPDPPAGPVRDGLGRRDRQRLVGALAEEHALRARTGPPGGRSAPRRGRHRAARGRPGRGRPRAVR